MQAARSQGKRASLNVDKLIINDPVHTVDSLSALPSELSPARRATRTDDQTGVTEVSPISNFNNCNIVLPEATHFKDKDAERRIIEATTPLECYHIGQHIKNIKKD